MTEEKRSRSRSFYYFRSAADGEGKPRRRYFRLTRAEDTELASVAAGDQMSVVDWVRKIVIGELTRRRR